MKIILETERLQLRQFTTDDNKYLLPIMQNKEVNKFISLEHVFGPINHEYVEKMLERFFKTYESNGFGLLGVVYKKTNELIGWCGLHKMQLKDGEVIELAYTLDKKYWGQGLATEAAIAVKNYTFNTLKLPYIVSCIDSKNVASIKVAKKLGMQYWKDSEFFGKSCQVYKVENEINKRELDN